jgi:hypothetical protein
VETGGHLTEVWEETVMRTLIIVGFIGVSLATLAVQSSHASIVSANWDIKNETGATAYDFHVVVIQPTTPPTNWVNGAFTHHDATPAGPVGVPRTIVTWDGGTVANDGSTHVGVEFDSGVGEARAHDAWWTNKDGTQLGEKLFLPDFEATPLFEDTEFSVINDADTSHVFDNFSFKLGQTAHLSTSLFLIRCRDLGLPCRISRSRLANRWRSI